VARTRHQYPEYLSTIRKNRNRDWVTERRVRQ